MFDEIATTKTYVPESNGGGNFLRYFKDGETTFWFAESDVSKINVAGFHFVGLPEGGNVSLPCPGKDFKDQCPGCTSEDKDERKITSRLITPVFDGTYMNLMAIPYSLKESIERFYDRDDTLQARPYTVYRTKNNGRVSYSMDREDKDVLPDFPEYDFSVQDVLREMWKYATDHEYRMEEKAQRDEAKKDREKSSDKPSTEAPANPVPESTKPTSALGGEDFDKGEMSEEEIRGMSFFNLVKLAETVGVKIGEDDGKQAIADAVIRRMSM